MKGEDSAAQESVRREETCFLRRTGEHTMAFQLENLEILARGGEADLYILDENRILRVLRKEDPSADSLPSRGKAPSFHPGETGRF